MDKIEEQRSKSEKMYEFIDYLTNLIKNNDDRYVFECASSSGTMTIYDKVDKIYYVSNIQQIKYDADGNVINL